MYVTRFIAFLACYLVFFDVFFVNHLFLYFMYTCCEQQGVAQGGNMKYLTILLHEPKLETAACTGSHMYMLSVSTHTEYTPGSLDMLSLWTLTPR